MAPLLYAICGDRDRVENFLRHCDRSTTIVMVCNGNHSNPVFWKDGVIPVTNEEWPFFDAEKCMFTRAVFERMMKRCNFKY